MDNATQTMTEQAKIHPFERAGLGIAPFRFVRTYVSKYQACQGAPIQAGSSCDYCATSIMQVCVIRSSDGREFKVGCDCVAKVGAEFDNRLLTAAESAKRSHGRKVRAALKVKKASKLTEILADATMCAALTSKPHPTPWCASRGDTLLDWAEWMVSHSGAAGKAKTLKVLTAALAA